MRSRPVSCDTTTAQSEGKRLDAALAFYEDTWQSIARYSIVRSRYGHANRVIATGQTYAKAKPECARLDALACEEVGCRPEAFGRPLHYLQLENPEETRQAVKALRGSRTASPT